MNKLSLVFIPLLILYSCTHSKNYSEVTNTQNILNNFKNEVYDSGIVALVDDGHLKDTASIGVA